MKRGAEEQITKDTVERDDDGSAEVEGTFDKAPPEVLAKRRIIKVRRSLPTPPADSESKAPNPFAALNSAASAGNGIAQQQSAAPPEANASLDAKPTEPTEKTKDIAVGESEKANAEPEAAEPEKEAKAGEPTTDAPKAEDASKDEEPDKQQQTNDSEAKDGPQTSEQPAAGTSEGKPEDKAPPTEVEASVKEKAAEDVGKADEKPSDMEKQDATDKQETTEKPVDANDKNEDPAAPPAGEGNETGEVSGEKAKPAVPQTGSTDDAGTASGENAKETEKAAEAEKEKDAANSTGNAANGGIPKPALTFGNISGAPPLTFASAAAADNGASFNIKVAPAPPPTKPPPAREFKEAPVQTGEEDETELFRARAKLYSLEVKNDVPRWRERGVGSLKLNKHTETERVRLVMRTEATLRVVLNTPVFAEFNLDRATERSLRFQGYDVDDTEAKNRTSFLVRFSTRETTSGLVEAIDKWKKSVESKESK